MLSKFLCSLEWQSETDCHSLSDLECACLFLSSSLTVALRRLGELSVQLISERWTQALYPREQQLLCQDEAYWVREIYLQVNCENVIFARSVIPRALCQDVGVLTQMGTRPLGEFLFQNQIRRSAFEWARTPLGLARHSLFYFGDDLSLLVGECFLDTFWQSYATSFLDKNITLFSH